MSMILDAFAGRYLEKLAELAEGEIGSILGVKNELQKLQRMLERTRGYLEDAEARRFRDPRIHAWVMELKDLMYDADDLLDLCSIEGGKLLQAQPSASAVRATLTFIASPFKRMKYQHEIGTKVKELNDRLKEIADNRSILSLLEFIDHGPQDDHRKSRRTSSVEVKADVVGTQIEDAARSLINLIVQNDSQKCFVVGIVGMGGIGKSTLARKIYNDERILENFPKRVWLHVSKQYTEIELFKVIISNLGGDSGGAESAAELEPKLISLLPNKLFLVLDDIWSADVWQKLLRATIRSAVANCAVLVSTRHESVARSLKATVHHVKEMDEGTCWELLCNEVFEDSEEEEMVEFAEIGAKLVQKCHGLPLAVKAIAGVLRSKQRSKIEWEKVLDSGTWSMSQFNDELPGALYLSYEDLPSYLKQCFLYCSLYPNTSGLEIVDLGRLWVAEGFIKPQGNRLLEDIAEDYYRELIWRNLLKLEFGNASMTKCSMHDLLRSLAHFLTEGEAAYITDNQTLNTNPLTKLRRLSMSNMGEKLKFPAAVVEEKCLRAFFLLDSPQTQTIEVGQLDKLSRLRLLYLNDLEIESIPNSIGSMIHLRYLDLDRTNIREIPDSIGCLVNLQTLSCCGCEFLQRLPQSVTSLYNLRCLHVDRSPLTHLPKGIGQLKNLNHLDGFVIGCDENTNEQDEGCDFEELQSLFNLRFLSVKKLERAVTGAGSALAHKPFLKHFVFWGLPPGEDDNPRAVMSVEQIQRLEEIYNELSLPSSLQTLRIYDFAGLEFPRWMMSPSLGASFLNLEYLTLERCRLCRELPPYLHQLPQLKELHIFDSEAITTIGPEFLGGSLPRATVFPKLELLEFAWMPNWEEWLSYPMVEASDGTSLKLLPKLKKLKLLGCSKLRSLPEALSPATNLQELSIQHAFDLREIKNLPSLTGDLVVSGSSRLETISHLPSLKCLTILNCLGLKCVENLNALQHLVLVQRNELPQWLFGLVEQHQAAPAAHQTFRKFELRCNLELLKKCLRGSVHWHLIEKIPEVRIRTFDGSSYILYTKRSDTYETNVEAR